MYIFLYLIFYRITPEETALYSIYYVIEYNITRERGEGGEGGERVRDKYSVLYSTL